MKKLLLFALSLILLVGLAACGGGEEAQTPSEPEQNNAEGATPEAGNDDAVSELGDTLKIGVTAGPHEEIMEKAKEVAAADGLELEIVVFSDYVIPNIALDEGELDVNSYQHKPFLDQFKIDRNVDLIEVATTVNFPMGIYSADLQDVSEIQEGDKIGLPNDPTNGARSLVLFESAGLIKLNDGINQVEATVYDIEENPLNLQFIELEASQIPRQLDELAAAAINTNFAIEHGYVPTEDSIFMEPKDSPWVNLIAVRTENKDDPAIQKLIAAYQSEEVKQFIEERFEGSVIPSW